MAITNTEEDIRFLFRGNWDIKMPPAFFFTEMPEKYDEKVITHPKIRTKDVTKIYPTRRIIDCEIHEYYIGKDIIFAHIILFEEVKTEVEQLEERVNNIESLQEVIK